MGSYRANVIELKIYQQKQDTQKFQQAFEELYFQKESFLALDEPSYRFLLAFSVSYSGLQKHTLDLYQKYIKYQGYQCSVENNMIIFYITRRNNENASVHFDLVMKNKSANCPNPKLVSNMKMKILR
ncbi:hypothetical protein CVPH_1537 [Abyssogena phaseoliformis symbiont OG214]|nr:hypothetical protein CVPH_1537 [Abyssogena phaseoliformis symbiont OG214]